MIVRELGYSYKQVDSIGQAMNNHSVGIRGHKMHKLGLGSKKKDKQTKQVLHNRLRDKIKQWVGRRRISSP